VIWPKILQAYGRADGDASVMRRQILLPTLMAGVYMPVLAGMVFVLLPPLVNMVLPQFANATAAAQMLSLGAVFLALPMAPNSLLIAHNREFTVVATKLAGAAVGALCCYWVITHIGGSLMALAVSASIGYAVAAALTLFVVLPQYEKNWVRTAEMFLAVFAPFGWTCLALKISSRVGTVLWQHFVMEPLLGLPPLVQQSPQLSWKFAIMRLVIFLCLMAPVALYGNRKTQLGAELARMVKSWINKGKKHDVEPDTDAAS
jgi:O-antigen/teichoic acid export membrane protein